jgi:hypothetical protein
MEKKVESEQRKKLMFVGKLQSKLMRMMFEAGHVLKGWLPRPGNRRLGACISEKKYFGSVFQVEYMLCSIKKLNLPFVWLETYCNRNARLPIF